MPSTQWTAPQYAADIIIRTISFTAAMIAGDTIAGTPAFSCAPAGVTFSGIGVGPDPAGNAARVAQCEVTATLPLGATIQTYSVECIVTTTMGETITGVVLLTVIARPA